ncbi:glycoside hydrolase family 27 protein [Sphingomonas sp. NFR15]|uniref:glycoside hydrolase family 27 protein n=1 Tax=Sphingomonas sp. NFR15 TaxID=1566282 RepID=UPI0008855C7D|nr:glycoside hydrolase family 27 protein [Sphingomonas sp. NFR15]SDA33031.1 Alpha galactosidase A [Sphingomonas sp. NFR15]
MSGIDRRTVLVAGAAAVALPGATSATPRAAASLAPRPPMGWNSWNSFATTITEAQAIETAGIMAAKLLPAGYDIFTVDIQWYDPDAKSYEYNAKPVPVIDANGRLLPALNRFPSSAGGLGFAPLAARVHALGLRFGIHVMRGIPRLAVERNLPVLGTQYRARDVADVTSVCSWNPDMYGVDMREPGAQAYYDSVFAQYARWGVDFVKVDDMSRPYDAHAPEIEAVALAIKRSGRPMVLSLSPGETPVIRADHVRRHAEMWRIADDFWDEWPQLTAQFTRFETWSPHIGGGRWPDGDMLPLGRLALGARDSRFTPDEQRTLMTLWSIARSPLIMGGDLRHLDAATLALLTNPEVIAVNQASSDNRPHILEDGTHLWSATAPAGGHYVALFNTSGKPRRVALPLDRLGVRGMVSARDLWERTPLADMTGAVARDLPSHGASLLHVRQRS